MIGQVIARSPLEGWIARMIGIDPAALTREHIEQYQLQKLRETVHRAYLQSPFYRRQLQGVADTEIAGLADFRRFPFTSAEDIRRYGMQFLCVSQDEISRVVTLESSGTTGSLKRIYFTPSDQEATVDFFRQGMSALAGAGDRVLILLPGKRPGSVGDLLKAALERLGARPVLHGPVHSVYETVRVLEQEDIAVIVGIPVQVLALARCVYHRRIPIALKSILLSTDYVPRAIVSFLQQVFGCQVFDHYGMTEMGLGGGIDCAAHAGYHLREADLYFEIVDPSTGEAVPEGREGEVVFTTLSRAGMPLIRYRTGDIARFIPGSCLCNTVLRRLGRITERRNGRMPAGENRRFTLSDLDEALFAVERVMNFQAAVAIDHGVTKLWLRIWTIAAPDVADAIAVDQAVNTIPGFWQARRSGSLNVEIKMDQWTDGLLFSGTAKRFITELNEADGNSHDIFNPTWKNSSGR